MKKFGKFIVAALSLAAAAGGVYYFMKNIVKKDADKNLDDFEEDFDDFDFEDDEEDDKGKEEASSREYVTINPETPKKEEEAPSDTEPVQE